MQRPRIHQTFLVLAALASCLTSYPGRVPGDTKLYLYLNPTRLISDSIWSWDARTLGGWVPHQNVGYLWPSGPFFAVFDAFAVPDWIAHRFWIASLMAIAGIGAYRLARFLGFDTRAALLSGAAYQFSPYVLPYISRTSALLIPWSLLPWLIVLTIRYSRGDGRRYLALFGLLIASSGGLNATALLMIAPAPIVWLHDQWRNGRIEVRRLISVGVHLGAVSLLASTWWLAGLFVQGRYGAAVLSYSEALQSTSATSSSTEVLRGLGYWLFYDKGPVAPLTSASFPYQHSIPVMVAGATLIVLGLTGIARSRHWRQPLSLMLLVGVVLSVGAHPFGQSNVLFRYLADNPTSSLSLALRSSTRAVPLIVLALAIGVGSWWDHRRAIPGNRRASLTYSMVVLLIFVNFPAALNGDIVDRALTRPDEIPTTWVRAGRYLDRLYDDGNTGAVLLVPGIESAAYRWGYPVDPLLPGLSRKPLLTRDWLPLGSPALMDLLYAFDDSFQNGTADPDSIAPIARMLGADTVMFVSSHQFERFGTVRPSSSFDLFDPVPQGLTFLESFGEPTVNEERYDDGPPVWSEEIAAHPARALPEIVLFSVDDAGSSSRSFDDLQLIAGDGTGLVDLAAISNATGQELMIAEASLDRSTLKALASDSARFVITDSNRRRAHHWRSSQNVWGATEPSVGVLTVRDDFDSRLPINPRQDERSETLIESAPVEAVATGYGALLSYEPEYRPRMSVDGDPLTSWRLGADRAPIGQILTLHSVDPLESLHLVQAQDFKATNWITKVSIRVDGAQWKHLDLDQTSRTLLGQNVDLDTPGRTIDIRIDGVLDASSVRTRSDVGFAEVIDSRRTSPEIVVLPSRLHPPAGAQVSYSLNRLRSDPFDRWREDPEQSILRRLTIPIDVVANVSTEIRLSPRADDRILMRALGVDSGYADERLHGSARWWGPAAFDDDPSTAWRSSVIEHETAMEKVPSYGTLTHTVDRPVEWVRIVQSAAPESSRIIRVSMVLSKSGKTVYTGSLDVGVNSPTATFSVPSVDADTMSLSIVDIEPRLFSDSRTHEVISAPVTISEIRSNAWTNTKLPDTFDSGCLDDLLSVGHRSIGIRLSGSVRSALNGDVVAAATCSPTEFDVEEGTLLRTSVGRSNGWDVDRVLFSGPAPSVRSDDPSGLTFERGRGRVSTAVPSCTGRCWIEMPFGYSPGWTGRLDGKSLDPALRSAAGRTLWQISQSRAGTLTATWSPQRWMWWGLGISFTTVATLVGFVFVDSIRRRRTSLLGASLVDDELEPDVVPLSWFARVTIGLILGSVLITPAWGLAVGVSMAVLRPHRLSRLAITAVGVGYAFVVLQQIRTGADPGFSWPAVFARAHRPMLASLVVYVVSMLDRRRIDSPEQVGL